jgi:hypothetical protein
MLLLPLRRRRRVMCWRISCCCESVAGRLALTMPAVDCKYLGVQLLLLLAAG